jgi:hypothetical protein
MTTTRTFEISQNGTVFVITDTIDEEGHVSRSRGSFTPGSDVSGQPQEVIDLCAATWTQAVIDAYLASLPPPLPPLPRIVSPRQIRQALTATGLRTGVEAAVAAGDQDLKDWWEFATQFEQDHPMVTGMATALGVTAQQLDDLFALAASL